ncbi:MAG: hypothetical protein GY822_08960 [Deltaproteobacteria bacterium]|nr:hypothetical protein [Deltaproteobacteria bacterium]
MYVLSFRTCTSQFFRRNHNVKAVGLFVAVFAMFVPFLVGQDAVAQIQAGDFCELKEDLALSSGGGQLDLEKGDTLEILQILKNSIEVKAESTKGLAKKKTLQKTCKFFWASCKLKKPIKLYTRKKKRRPSKKRRGEIVVESREKNWSRVRDGEKPFFSRTAELLQRCTFSKGPAPRPYLPQWPKRNMRKKNIVVLPFAVRGASDSEVKLVERTFSKAFVKVRKDAVGIPRRSIAETERSNSLKRIIEAVKIDANANARYAVVGMVKPGKGKSWSVTIALVDVNEEKVLKAAKSTAKRNSSKWAKKVGRLIASVLPKARRVPTFLPKIPEPPVEESSVTTEETSTETPPAEKEPVEKEPVEKEPVELASAEDAPVETPPATVENPNPVQVAEVPPKTTATPRPPEEGTSTTTPLLKKDVPCDCAEQAAPPTVSATLAPEVEVRIEERWLREKRPFYVNTLAGASFGMAAGFLVAGGTIGTLGMVDMFAVNDMKHSNPARDATIASMQQKSAVADVFFLASAASAGAGIVFFLLGVDVDGVHGE